MASVIFVNANVSGGTGNGDSWADAFDTLQDAFAVATPYDEIWVAAGQYFPDEGSGQTNDDMESTFNIPDNVSLFGGFVGTETLRAERDWEANITVLSGDIDNNDTTDINGVIIDTDYINGANANHVGKHAKS